MNILFKATNRAAPSYSFEGETILAVHGGQEVTYDLSSFPEGGSFKGADRVGGIAGIRNVERSSGVLLVTLEQTAIASQYPNRSAHWRGLEAIDSADYDPSICYVVPTGMAGVDDYEIVQGVDVAGNTGWTVRKKEMADG